MFKWFLALLVLLSVSCSKDKNSSSKIVIAAQLSDLITLDPADIWVHSGIDYLYNTYQRLFSIDENGQIINDLVESYEFSEDKRILRVRIKKDQYFASGNYITAEDVVYSLQRVVMLQKNAFVMVAPLGFTPNNVRQCVRFVDSHTVEFEFKEAVGTSLILSCLASTASCILDSATLKKHEVNDDMGVGWLRSAHVGGGRLMLGSWQPGELLTLKKNPYHEDADKIKFTVVIIRHISDIATQTLLLQRGEIDIIRDISQEQIESIDPSKFNLVSVNQNGFWFINCNTKNKYLGHPEVQKALRYLVDYKAVIRVIGENVLKPLHTIVPKGVQGYIEDQPVPEFAPEKAKKIIHAAFGGDIELEMDVSHLSLGQVLQSDFAKGGIKLKLNYFDYRELLARLRKRGHQMTISRFRGDYVDPQTFFTTFLMSKSKDTDKPLVSSAAWRNSLNLGSLEKRAEAAAKMICDEKRIEEYKGIQKEFLKQPIIILGQIYGVMALSKDIKGKPKLETTALHFSSLTKGP